MVKRTYANRVTGPVGGTDEAVKLLTQGVVPASLSRCWMRIASFAGCSSNNGNLLSAPALTRGRRAEASEWPMQPRPSRAPHLRISARSATGSVAGAVSCQQPIVRLRGIRTLHTSYEPARTAVRRRTPSSQGEPELTRQWHNNGCFEGTKAAAACESRARRRSHALAIHAISG